MITQRLARLTVLLVAICGATACGSGGSGGSRDPSGLRERPEVESNDTSLSATELTLGEACTGELGLGDQDWWWFDGIAGESTRIEILARRWDGPGWAATSGQIQATLEAPDGSVLTVVDAAPGRQASDIWIGDRDITNLRLPTTGRYHLKLELSSLSDGGGGYCLLRARMPGAAAEHLEQEGDTGSNDLMGQGAEDISGATRVEGELIVGDVDLYRFFSPGGLTRLDLRLLWHANGRDVETEAYGTALFSLFSLFDASGVELLDETVTRSPAAQGAEHSCMLPRGSYFFRIRPEITIGLDLQPLPMSYTLLITSGVGPTVAESGDAPDDPEAPDLQELSSGDVVLGRLGAGDEGDAFTLRVRAGDLLVTRHWSGDQQLGEFSIPGNYVGSTGGSVLRLQILPETALYGTSQSSPARTQSVLIHRDGLISLRVQRVGLDPGLYSYAFEVQVTRRVKREAEAHELSGFERENDTLADAEAIPAAGWVGGDLPRQHLPDVWSFRATAGSVRVFSFFGGSDCSPGHTRPWAGDHPGLGLSGLVGPAHIAFEVIDASETVLLRVDTKRAFGRTERGTARGSSALTYLLRMPSSGTYFVRAQGSGGTPASPPYVIAVE